MWWIVGLIVLFIGIFLWMIVHSAAKGMDEHTRKLLDEEQTRAVSEILRKRETRGGEEKKDT